MGIIRRIAAALTGDIAEAIDAASPPSGGGGGPVIDRAPINTLSPQVSGNALVGQTLTGSNGGWLAQPAPTFTYEWTRNDVPIAGATAATYTLVTADAGQLVAFRVTATNTQGTQVANSASTYVFRVPASVNAPVISGAAPMGSLLSSTAGTWTGNPTPALTYQWYRAGGMINGATSSTYTTVQLDVGMVIDCRVTGTNAVGSATRTSNTITVTAALTLPVNTATPTVTGSTALGSVLTTTNGTWTGNPAPTITRQWLRDGTPIAGATATTYTTVTDDLGRAIVCRVTATNSQGASSTNSNTIVPTAALAAPTITTAPTVTGPTVVGGTLYSDTGTWAGNPGPSFTFEWLRGASVIAGATASTYVTTGADVGQAIRSRVTATNSEGSANSSSNTITIVAQPVAPSNTVAPAITGTLTEGSALTCSTGTWTGTAPITYAYQWRANGAPIGGATSATYVTTGQAGASITCMVTASNTQGNVAALSNAVTVTAVPTAPSIVISPTVTGLAVVGSTLSCTTGTWSGTAPITYTYAWYRGAGAIAGATSATYVSVVGDIGSAVTCRVTATNGIGNATQPSSNAITPTAAPVAPSNTVAPVVSGSAIEGSTLACTTGTWTGDAPITFTRQWRANGTAIPGQTGASFITTGNVGNVITCTVTASNATGSASQVSNGITVTAVPASPSNTVAPVISGGTTVGQTLTCTTGTWTGDAPITYAYQWLRDGMIVTGSSASRVIIAGDVGAVLTCRVTATNGAGSADQVSNGITAVAAPTVPANTVAPVVSGSAVMGSTLTSTTGTWTGTAPITYTYQWRRAATNIAGATAATYVTVLADVAAAITCRVTGTNAAGNAAGTSNAITVTSVPANTALPTISGTRLLGAVMTVTNGTWTGSPTPTYTRQWTRNGTNIAGATSASYTAVQADVGTILACRVTATNSAGATSATATGSVINALPVNTAAPVVSGSAVMGATLTTTNGTWSGYPTPTYTYAWLRAGTPIAGATAATYVTVLADVGTAVTCRVTATNDVGAVNATSNATTITGANTAPVNTVAPAVTGANVVGSVLTCGTGTWTGNPTPTFTYAWYRGAGAISGATANTYTLVTGDVGQNITCRVTGTNVVDSATATSNIIVGAESTSGSVLYYTSANGVIGDDGHSYQRGTGGAGYQHAYTEFGADGKKYVEMQINQINGGDMAVAIYGGSVYNPPATGGGIGFTSGQPGISIYNAGVGAIQWGANGGATSGNIGANLAGPLPASFTIGICIDPATRRVWFRRTGQAGWAGGGDPAAGTTPSVTLGGTDEIRVGFMANTAATNATAYMRRTAEFEDAAPSGFTLWGEALTPVAPTNTVAPAVTGGAQQGSTLTTTMGTWIGTPTPVLSRQWRRGAADIAGATALTYVTTSDDVGLVVTCRITAVNSSGSVYADSNGTTVTTAPLTAPVNTVAPVVSGSSTIGHVLTVGNGTWTGNPAPTFTYQWRRALVDISGETAATYTTVTADDGIAITCRVTGTNSQGNSYAISNAITPATTPDYATWANPLPSLTISPDGLTAYKNGAADPPHYGHCNMSSPLSGKVYVEVLATFDAPYGNASVINFYGGTLGPEDYQATASVGQMWGEPGVAIGITSQWTAICYANYGMGTNEVGNSSWYDFDRTPFPVTRRFMFAIDADLRRIWARTADGPVGWIGGGNPVTNTTPSVIINGTSPIYMGATSARPANTLVLLLPADFTGTVPSGFTPGILQEGLIGGGAGGGVGM